MRDKKGRGSVSRCLRYSKRYNTEPEFKRKILEYSKVESRKRKNRMNKRCLDCKKLISPVAIRCRECSIKHIRNCYLKDTKDNKNIYKGCILQ